MTPVLLELLPLAPCEPLPLRTDVARIIRALDLANCLDVLEFCFGPDDELFDAPAPPPPPPGLQNLKQQNWRIKTTHKYIK